MGAESHAGGNTETAPKFRGLPNGTRLRAFQKSKKVGGPHRVQQRRLEVMCEAHRGRDGEEDNQGALGVGGRQVAPVPLDGFAEDVAVDGNALEATKEDENVGASRGRDCVGVGC